MGPMLLALMLWMHLRSPSIQVWKIKTNLVKAKGTLRSKNWIHLILNLQHRLSPKFASRVLINKELENQGRISKTKIFKLKEKRFKL